MEKGRKKNFSTCEVNVLISEVEARHKILFGSLSTGISTKTKQLAWTNVAKAVSGKVRNTGRADVKKKRSDIKVDMNKKVAVSYE